MRILHVNKFLYRRGGAEAYMEDVAALQAAAGDEVAFYGMAHPKNVHLEFADDLAPYVELDPPPASLSGKLRAAGRMFYSGAAARGIGHVIERYQPDVVHFHNIYHQLSPSVLRPVRDQGIPILMTLHDYKLACPTYLFLDKGEICEACLGGHFHEAARRRCKDGSFLASALSAAELFVHTAIGAYGAVDLFVCPSQFMAAKMTEAGVFPDRLRVLHNFVDAGTFEPKEQPGGPILYASRLSYEKGTDVLVEAMAFVAPHVRLDIAGDGPERQALEARAAEVAPGRIHFHGHRSKTEVIELMRAAAVVAVPSRCYENQPLTVLEAFSAAVPVVGSALGGIAELVVPGETGDLVPHNDPRALAEALDNVLRSPERAMAMGRQGRRKVEAEFSPAGHHAGLRALYEEARSGRQSGGR